MRKRFYASDLGSCETQIYFKFITSKSHGQIPGKIQEIWNDGLNIHKEIIEEYEKAGMLIEKEIYVTNEQHRISGEADCIIKWDNYEPAVEIKSINHKDYTLLVGPLLDDRLQLAFYLDRLKKDYGLLVYIDKKKTIELGGRLRHARKVFKVDYDKIEIESWYTKLDKLWERIETKTVPERRATLCRECLRCYFLSTCRDLYRKESITNK